MNSPLLVKLSGGRSSGRMLRLLLDDGRFVRGRDFAVFTNTGKEMPQTLDFLVKIEREWECPITWLEYDWNENRTPKESFRIVNYETAARDGRPFMEAMLASHCGVIPRVVNRVCTAKLKIAVSEKWTAAMGLEDPIVALGYRKGEEHRRARALAHGDKRLIFPLMDAEIDNAGVIQWWRAAPFDLELPTIGGKTAHGNCDLCFLKSMRTTLDLISECPKRVDWWIALEDALTVRRNQRECRWWMDRESENSAWRKIPEPSEFDSNKHRRDAEGQVWLHDGRTHRVTLHQKYSYRELRDMVAKGVHKRIKQRPTDMFLDDPPANMALPCECGD